MSSLRQRARQLVLDERGLGPAAILVIAVISFVGPTVIVGVGMLFEDENPRSPSAPAIERAVVTGPAPPANQCAVEAYTTFGLRWQAEGKPGWTVDNLAIPTPDSPNYSTEVRTYKAVVTDRVRDALALWMERDCHKEQKPLEQPSPSVSVEQDAPLTINGTYVISEDVNARSTGQPAADDPLGCAARRVPTEITVSQSGAQISLTYADDLNNPRPYSVSGRFDASNGSFVVDYPDASGKQIEGRFAAFGDRTVLLDGRMYSGECTFTFQGEKKV